MRTLKRARIVNGALIALAALLSAAVVVTEGSVTTSEKLAREGNVLAVYRPDEIDSIRITRSSSPGPGATGSSELLLLRDTKSHDPHDFFLDARGGRKAEPAAVAELLSALEYAVWLRSVGPAEVDRKAFGLEQPRLELRLDMGGTSYRLAVGAPAPTPQGAHYAELGGTGVTTPEVGLISGDLVEKLERDPHAFLGKLLLPYAKSDLKELRLSGDGGNRDLVRDAAGFRLGGGKGPRVDGEAVDRLLFQMARVSAEQYLTPDAARKALSQGATVRIEQTPKEGAPVTVEVGGTCPTQADEPSVVALRTTEPVLAGCVPATVLPSLTAGEAELVLRTPFSLHADEVDHVTIVETTSTGPKRLEAIRSGAAFELLEPRKQSVELDAGNDLLKALVSPNGELWTPSTAAGSGPRAEAPDLAALGLSPPRGTVTLRGLTEGTSEPLDQIVRFSGPDAAGRVWLQREDDGAVLALGRSAAWAFSADDTWTRPRELIGVDKEAIRRIVVRQGDTQQAIEQQANGAVRLLEPPGFEVDSPLATDWLSAVAHLRAARWLRRDDERGQSDASAAGGARNDERSFQVEVTYAGAEGERSAKFFVAGRTVGGFRARWEGDSPGWFVLPTEVGRALQTAPISRFAVSVDIENVSRLVLSGPGISHTLERRAGELMSADGSLTRDAITELEQALAALRPVAALHVGPALPGEGFDAPELVLVGATHALGREEKPFTLRFGRISSHLGQTVQYARADGVNATFIVDRADVEHVLDLL